MGPVEGDQLVTYPFTESGEKIEKVLKTQLAILTVREHLTDPAVERVFLHIKECVSSH